jgi:hypothetical protein
MHATRIVNGTATPHEGARSIWNELFYQLEPGDHSIDPFVYWADEYEDAVDDERRRYCEAAILQSAQNYLNEPA